MRDDAQTSSERNHDGCKASRADGVGRILLTVVLYRGRAPASDRKGVRRTGGSTNAVLPAGAVAPRWPAAAAARAGVVASRHPGAGGGPPGRNSSSGKDR